jgi:DNA primase
MEFVERLKSAVDIVKVVSEYVPRLEKRGARYVGLCPFHSEKTPSFSVHATHQFYKCFGCGAGGDVIKFVMEIENLTFYEALKHLAERHGIPMPKQERLTDGESRLRSALYAMHEIAARQFQAALASGAGSGAREYLRQRGLAPGLVEEFGLGYAEPGGQALLKRLEREGFGRAELEESGLVIPRQDGGWFDRFRGRLMFPVHNETGKVIAFAGRALAEGDEPKYLNSPETRIYKKSHVLYNLHRARKAIREADGAVLVEGYMDAIGLWAAGVRQAVASCGTALTPEQVRMLRRHSDKLVVNFDADAAGAEATERSIHLLLEEGMRVRVLALEEGLDPDEYIRKYGPEAYRARLGAAPGYFYWLADRVRARFDLRTLDGRVEGLRRLLPAIQKIPDKLERAAVAGEIASYLGVDAGLVLEQFRKAAAQRRGEPAVAAREPLAPTELVLLKALLADERARRQVLPRLAALGSLEGLRSRPILEAMAHLEAGGTGFSYAALEARLAEPDKALLASLVFADEEEQEPDMLPQALACLESLEHKGREARRAELRARVKAAEREGRIEEALRLAAELSRVQ